MRNGKFFRNSPWQWPEGDVKRFRTYYRDRKNFVYLGGVTNIRGVEETLQAIKIINNFKNVATKLVIVGNFNDQNLKDKILSQYGDFIILKGWLTQEKAFNILVKSIAGMCLYQPVSNHMRLRSNKVYEYMVAKIPVLYSNFPDWKEKLDNHNLGLATDPMNINEIAENIMYLIENKEKAIEMGKNGFEAVNSDFSWKNEEKKLLELYSTFE